MVKISRGCIIDNPLAVVSNSISTRVLTWLKIDIGKLEAEEDVGY